MLELGFISIPLLNIHLTTLVLVVMIIIFADTQGFLWMRGKKELLDAKTLRITHRLMWTGLMLMIASGLSMFWPARTFYLQSPVFIAKMIFVFALIVNGFFIGKHTLIATTRSFASLSKKEQLPLLISGMISGASWAGAIIAGFLLNR